MSKIDLGLIKPDYINRYEQKRNLELAIYLKSSNHPGYFGQSNALI